MTNSERWNLLATPTRRKVLFAALYVSEGAPIGFLWWALPTRLTAAGVSVQEVTTLTSLLVLPWVLKFLWAPLIDVCQGRHWTLRHWIVAAQLLMGLTLLPLLWVDLTTGFSLLLPVLMAHAFFAATQDVAIDAFCIRSTQPLERGRLNGWMQAGMLLGRSLLGGGALVLAARVGDTAVVVALIAVIWSTLVLVLLARESPDSQPSKNGTNRLAQFFHSLRSAAGDRHTWLGLAFALTVGTALETLGVLAGPLLIHQGWSETQVGWLQLAPLVGAMLVGSLVGGYLADAWGHRRAVIGAQLWLVSSVVGVATVLAAGGSSMLLVGMLLVAYGGIGMLTAAIYALLMDITRSDIAATQWSAFMGAGNGCESWSHFAAGRMHARFGYPPALLAMCLVALASLLLLRWMRRPAIEPLASIRHGDKL